MELQGVIVSLSKVALGSIASIENRLQHLFPGITFEWTSSGPEKLAEFDSRNVVIPLLVRRILEAQRSSRCGEWSNDFVTATFNCGSDDHVERIWLTISGDDHEANQLLSAIRGAGWSIEHEKLEVVTVAPDDRLLLKGNATLFVENQVPKIEKGDEQKKKE